MDNLFDYKKFAILYVDDEELSLKYFSRAFQDKFWILTANSYRAGADVLEQHQDKIGLLITDQRMPGETGVQLLEKVRQSQPKIIRILTTAYSDIDAAIDAVNSGAIYKYVTKPWDVSELEMTIRRALEFFIVQRERDQLLREKLSALHKMMITDRVLSLGILAARLGHHVRNSLVAVRTFLDLAPEKLLEEKIETEQLRNPNFWKDFYGHAQSQIRRITTLLTELVDVTERADFPALAPVQVDEILAESLEALADRLAEKGITVVNQIPAGLPSLTADRHQFRRLFDLLLKDEIVNLQKGGHIFLNARSSSAVDPELEIEIRNDGPGLPREALASVFDPFFPRSDDHQDFGINLMACYFIVYHHGGRIDVRSDKDNGVTFTLTFPRHPKTGSRAEEEEAFIAKVLMNDALWEKMISSY